MQGRSYRTLDDLRSIVTNAIPEGVSLEYKASDIVTKRRISPLCKTVTALANSAGGQFAIGVTAKDGVPIALDGGVPPPTHRDWIYQVVNTHTFPPVESLEVFEISDTAGNYYVIDVPPSSKAPHQSDGKYYKRRGPHSDPMEHYEIEDVRNRPKDVGLPLRIGLTTRHGVLLLLHLRNDHPSESVSNLKFVIDTNFKLDRSGIKSLSSRGLRNLRPQTELFYHLESIFSVLQQSSEPELCVQVEYRFLERYVRERFIFFIGDFTHSAIIHSEEVNALQKLTEEVQKVSRELEKMRQSSEPLLNMVDGSGLRLSLRTLSALTNKPTKYDPREFDWAGYQLILDISRSEAFKLEHTFKRWGEDAQKAYEELPAELRAKFEAAFNVKFN